jgi:hypothetical protein
LEVGNSDMRKLKLLKVILQPVFVLDDGVYLTEQLTDPVEVPASSWPAFAKEGFAQNIHVLEKQINSTHVDKEKPQKLRLLKVTVQSIFIIDDGENITEQSTQPVTIASSGWEQFATERFEQEVNRLYADFEKDSQKGKA